MPKLIVSLPFSLTVDLLAVAHVLVGSAVTLHVLLHKRDVRASIAWIGLAWLSPLLGGLLYYVFGINRVTRRAFRLTRTRIRRRDAAGAHAEELAGLPPGIAAIARVGARIAKRPLTSGNSLTALDGGEQAYPAMLAAIDGATKSVALASYIFRADRAGAMFIDALAAARSRGVEVRVLLDGVGSGYLFSAAARRLAAAGIPVARFMHFWPPWRMPFLNMRNHKKLLIVDGTVGFTGGLNIGAANSKKFRPARPVKDTHFRVSGPIVSHLMLAFADDWSFTSGEALEGVRWWPAVPAAGSLSARGICSGPDEDAGNLEAIFAAAVGAATRRLRIVTPYFLPDGPLTYAIGVAALRGVEVDLVVPERSDHWLVDWAMRDHFRFFAAPGISIWLTPAPFDHSKLLTVDGIWSAVGSGNWDVRSCRLNFEFMLECYGERTTAELDGMIDRKLASARLLTPKETAARPIGIRLRDASARLFLPYL